MAGIRVDPPPINTRVVDENGYPTRELKEYLYRIWARVADPSGNLLDQTNNSAGEAGEAAEEGLELIGTIEQQIIQLSGFLVDLQSEADAIQASLNSHVAAQIAHGSIGAVVGFDNAALPHLRGVVFKAGNVFIPGSSSASTVGGVGAAPATYTQAHSQALADAVTNTANQFNTLLGNYNALAASVNSLKNSLIAAGMM